jgi:glycosyltransferase involved in cell wall biosynthesis
VSAYNAAELAALGFARPGVLPLVIAPEKWDFPADPQLMKQLQDGKANVLFVGRLAPNKRQEHLIEAFAHYLTMDPEARLLLVGSSEAGDPYYRFLVEIINRCGVARHTVVTGLVTDQQLLAYYRTAQLLWSMSEHEGFCVPAVEAMWFDIPVLAYKSTALPETLGEAGVMFTTKDDLVQIAALAKLLVRERELRTKVLAAQRRRRNNFLPEVVWAQLDALLEVMEADL